MSSTTASISPVSSRGSERQRDDDGDDGASVEPSRKKIRKKALTIRKKELADAADTKRAEQLVKDKQKSQRSGDNEVQEHKKTCGAYNYTGCSYKARKCKFAHVYDLRAGTLYFQLLSAAAKVQKGLKVGQFYPTEFDDLRRRNVNSLTNQEKEALSKMPHLDVWRDAPSTTGKWSLKRKHAAEEQQVNIDMESEHQEPKLTQQERAACLREEAQATVNKRISEATNKAIQE